MKILDRLSSNASKRTRWEIEEQSNRITDSMRVDILNMISTSIDAHDRKETNQLARDIKNWLDETYGRSWTVEIYTIHNGWSNKDIHNATYFRVKDNRLGLIFVMFK